MIGCRQCEKLRQELADVKHELESACTQWARAEKRRKAAEAAPEEQAKQELPEEHDDEYELSVHCTNCGSYGRVWLPKGKPLRNMYDVKSPQGCDPLCWRCKCATLEMVSSWSLGDYWVAQAVLDNPPKPGICHKAQSEVSDEPGRP